MTDRVIEELLACCEAALGAGKRSATIARALAEAHRSGLRPPDDVIEAYLARLEHDHTQLHELRERVTQIKATRGGS